LPTPEPDNNYYHMGQSDQRQCESVQNYLVIDIFSFPPGQDSEPTEQVDHQECNNGFPPDTIQVDDGFSNDFSFDHLPMFPRWTVHPRDSSCASRSLARARNKQQLGTWYILTEHQRRTLSFFRTCTLL